MREARVIDQRIEPVIDFDTLTLADMYRQGFPLAHLLKAVPQAP